MKGALSIVVEFNSLYDIMGLIYTERCITIKMTGEDET